MNKVIGGLVVLLCGGCNQHVVNDRRGELLQVTAAIAAFAAEDDRIADWTPGDDPFLGKRGAVVKRVLLANGLVVYPFGTDRYLGGGWSLKREGTVWTCTYDQVVTPSDLWTTEVSLEVGPDGVRQRHVSSATGSIEQPR